ncbi:uncharacterized protein LOC132717092 isoform X1 [Ruditapes philippinarum]|uniref:uncharacterized protein LOC132717092 isoform X1 n=1 Tax=Ruditapes philippinarum TaxID=129788 RepID=UPI00295B13B3|nr:uncharacterized protein LOC132717092 isoform X1 [Ruditapes philippinarum]
MLLSSTRCSNRKLRRTVSRLCNTCLSFLMQQSARNCTNARRWIAVAVLFSLCMVTFFLLGTMRLPPHLNPDTSKWLPYKAQPVKDKLWFEHSCLKTGTPDVFEDLEVMMTEWRKSKDKECRKLFFTFLKLFRLTFQEAEIVIPDAFSSKVRKWLGNKEELFAEAKKQTIISVYNRYTREQNVYNPIRSKRPMSIPKIPERQYIDQIARETQDSCDFCKYKDSTAQDVFGRIDNKYSYSASNTFKLDRWHALFMLKSHHPHNWTQEQFLDLMLTSQQWFDKVYKIDSSYKYPSLIWDLLPHAGASQVHPHIHGFLDKDAYQGAMELWKKAALDYNTEVPDHNYFTDIIEMHSILGLTVNYGKAVAFANLVPKRDNEIVIVSEKADRDFYLLWYYVMRGFLDDMGEGSLCFSSGIALPSMTGVTGSNSLPAYVRILTRGPVADIRADVSSLELFAASNANTDPYRVIKVMQRSVENRGARSR